LFTADRSRTPSCSKRWASAIGRSAWPSRTARSGASSVARRSSAGGAPAGDGGGFIQRYPVGAATAPNVVGIVPGRDARLAREYVIVVAHLDHIGVGRPVGRGWPLKITGSGSTA